VEPGRSRASRNDDDSNVLCLPSRYIDTATAVQLSETGWRRRLPAAARFKRRIKELDQLDEVPCPANLHNGKFGGNGSGRNLGDSSAWLA